MTCADWPLLSAKLADLFGGQDRLLKVAKFVMHSEVWTARDLTLDEKWNWAIVRGECIVNSVHGWEDVPHDPDTVYLGIPHVVSTWFPTRQCPDSDRLLHRDV